MTNRLAITCLAVAGALLAVTGTAQAAFPGANGKIVYLKQDPRAGVQALVAQSPRGGSRTVLRPGTTCPTSFAAYSPDGARLATQACDRLATTNADGSGFLQLPLFSKPEGSSGLYYAYDSAPGWSPDGTRLVFTSVSGYDDGFQPQETDRLAIVNSDGSSPRVLTGAEGAGAQWSTRGLIAYSTGGKVPAIYTIRPNGSGMRLLLRRATQPEWSPDGHSISFIRGRWRSPGFRAIDPVIYLARANGKGVRRVVRGLYPTWSPNGKRLAFVQGNVRSDRVIWSLYTIRLDGTDRRLLARTRDDLIAPDWQPLP
jgi:dipeptidyl aminopeptidase/acylaminoacyl peptidase